MIKFTKMHGLGNDYIYINRLKGENILEEEKISEITRYFSNRHFGIGGDGVILIEESELADFKMRIFNSDGTEAEMCGNGIRCFAKYVYEKGLTVKKEISIETKAGIKYAMLEIKNNIVETVIVNMGKPQIMEKYRLKVLDKEFEIYSISMGNPHAIVYVDDVDNFNVEKYGKVIEKLDVFPEKTNVEFVQVLGSKFIKLRVWERGSGETFACGTGACAAVCMSIYLEKTLQDVIVILKRWRIKNKFERR